MSNNLNKEVVIENLIIGAGPAGLQLGYFFKKNNIPYLILERAEKCGSFFDKYPHARQLISINKVHTGSDNKDFNLRHDWNSLINDEGLLFKDYSKEFYPSADDLVRYLNDFYKSNNLNIEFNTNVVKITKHLGQYKIFTSDNKIFICLKLIMATGFTKSSRPKLKHPANIKHYSDYEKGHFSNPETLEKYNNKKVAIFGGGNASFELANVLTNHCSHIHVINASKDYAITSHYAGDLRSVYMPFLDSFFLKSLNCYSKDDYKNEPIDLMKIIRNDDNTLSILDRNNEYVYGSVQLQKYDEIIFCTGWLFDDSIFDFKIDMSKDKKFPQITSKFESTDHKNLYFIGTIAHSLDRKKSSGGFIHGFRYLIQFFLRINYDIPFVKTYIPYNNDLSCYDILKDKILTRINTASSIYQMFGVITDIFYYNKDTKQIIYVEDIPDNIVPDYVTGNGSNINGFSKVMLKYKDSKDYNLNTHDIFVPDDPIFLHFYLSCFKIDDDKLLLIYDNKFADDLTADFSNKSLKDELTRCLYACPLIF